MKNIQDLFLHEKCQRVEFEVFADNLKAVRLYEKFCKKYNGTKLCTLHRNIYFNGKFHDTYIYEFLVENIRNFLTEDFT
jgi:RimJ/RimL family protein N-acetyltransferase